jgi:hypothetical protein
VLASVLAKGRGLLLLVDLGLQLRDVVLEPRGLLALRGEDLDVENPGGGTAAGTEGEDVAVAGIGAESKAMTIWKVAVLGPA